MSQAGRTNRAATITLGVIVGLIVILGALYAWDYLSTKDNVPRGTSVGGVDIGGMTHDEAERTLQSQLGDAATQPVTVTAGERTSQLVPAESGLAIDWAATVDQAGEESANPLTRLRGLFGTHEVAVVSQVDAAALNPQIDRVASELRTEPVDGSVSIAAGKVETVDPVLGQQVDPQVLSAEVSEHWLNPEGIEVEPQPVEPVINDDVIKSAVDGPVAAAIAGPLTAKGSNDVRAVIEPERIGEFVTFANVEGRIVPEVNTEIAGAILGEQLSASETEAENARLNQDGSVTPHVDGTLVDWEATMADFPARVLGEQPREWDATYKPDPAEFTTDEARSATFDQVIGEFTTSGYSENSGHNIATIAAQVNGAIVNPGETFSLNGYTGPRGLAQGYIASGIIENGRSAQGVGGGVSQFTTTLYNASYFAGLEDIAHTPHSYYISRYPAGREATIWDGGIDLVFRNTNSHPIRIETSVGGGDVTVKILGVKEVNVESSNGGRWATTEPQVQNLSGDNCIASSGIPGFTTSDTRTITDLSGNVIDRQTQTWTYDPQPIVRCS
nr:VanW family protein [Corynebacterium doosanense]